ncbi:hypothetical protein KQI86_07620 [Clostridium sp. MSJ-11]|uniref:Uncharacterized protein n=1 Tax=Clostridium mobile TaxID=2841512 RepID=A0ABS6EIA4_9CLOT|nr:hypothetical protein [Clostridium mobile]MBU5484195.1 hypothetical protein [Clostridium mobile]
MLRHRINDFNKVYKYYDKFMSMFNLYKHEEVKSAAKIEYFKKYHKPPKFVVWHNDSDDGVSLNHILSNRL